VHYKLEKVNFITYNDNNNNNNSMVNNNCESQTIFKQIRYIIFSLKFHYLLKVGSRKSACYLPIKKQFLIFTENFGKLPTNFSVPINFEP